MEDHTPPTCRDRQLWRESRRMAASLITYLAAAVLAASHAPAPANGTTAGLAARPLARNRRPPRPAGWQAARAVGPRGPLGGPLVLGVVAVRGRWVEVTAEALSSGRHGWVRFGRDVGVHPIRWTLRASLARRSIDVLRDGRIARTIPVGIGAPVSPTPTGRFADRREAHGPVRSGLRSPHPRSDGSPAALAGRLEPQHHVLRRHPRRLGTGYSRLGGCLHATEADVRYLMRTVPLGTPLQIVR
jgi:hypothetical protein